MSFVILSPPVCEVMVMAHQKLTPSANFWRLFFFVSPPSGAMFRHHSRIVTQFIRTKSAPSAKSLLHRASPSITPFQKHAFEGRRKFSMSSSGFRGFITKTRSAFTSRPTVFLSKSASISCKNGWTIFLHFGRLISSCFGFCSTITWKKHISSFLVPDSSSFFWRHAGYTEAR